MKSLTDSSYIKLMELLNANKQILWAMLVSFVVANVFTICFIRQEHYIYYHDQITYWTKLVYLMDHFIERPLTTIKEIIYSIRADDYNYLPATLLLPAGFLLGKGRLAYILSIVNIFAVPAVVSAVILQCKTARICGFNSASIPFIALGTAWLLPNFWQPILTGYPDVGGIVLINVILLIFMNGSLFPQQGRNLLLAALLIPILILFRRWYAYWGVSFYIAILFELLRVLLVTKQLERRVILRALEALLLQIAVSALLLLVIAPAFALRIVNTNYADIYSAFKESSSLWESLLKVFVRFGLFYFTLFVLGGIYAVRNKATRSLAIVLCVQWIIMFVLFARTQDFGRHQLYLLMPTMMLFSFLFVASCVARSRRFMPVVICVFGLLFGLNFLPAFSARSFAYAKTIPIVFAGFRNPPMIRNDIQEVDRLLDVLERLTVDPHDRIYVLASSEALNCSMLSAAHLSLNRHAKVQGKILWTHDIDKRDGFPENLLTARFVVIGDPIQYQEHTNFDAQRLIGIPAELILAQQGIGASFQKLPDEFNFDGNVRINIYEKVKPFSKADLMSLSGRIRRYYPDNPAIYEINSRQQE